MEMSAAQLLLFLTFCKYIPCFKYPVCPAFTGSKISYLPLYLLLQKVPNRNQDNNSVRLISLNTMLNKKWSPRTINRGSGLGLTPVWSVQGDFYNSNLTANNSSAIFSLCQGLVLTFCLQSDIATSFGSLQPQVVQLLLLEWKLWKFCT